MTDDPVEDDRGQKRPAPKVAVENDLGVRAFLQRAETRTASMHGLTGAFISGAGLLVLLPALLRDAFTIVAQNIFQFPNGLVVIGLVASFLIVAGLPLYAVYLLLHDLIESNFAHYIPGGNSKHFFPSLVMAPVTLPTDDASERDHNAVRTSESSETYVDFTLSKSDDALFLLERVEHHTRSDNSDVSDLIPPSRRRPGMSDDQKRLWTAFGMAGVVDRSLLDEVAKTETTQVRHALILRRLLLRYVKALLLLLLTTVIILAMSAVVQLNVPIEDQLGGFTEPGYIPRRLTPDLLLVMFSGLLLLWALAAPFLVNRPVVWIYHRGKQVRTQAVSRDRNLLHFERIVIVSSFVMVIAQAVVVLALYLNEIKGVDAPSKWWGIGLGTGILAVVISNIYILTFFWRTDVSK